MIHLNPGVSLNFLAQVISGHDRRTAARTKDLFGP